VAPACPVLRKRSRISRGRLTEPPRTDSYDPERVFAESFGIFVDKRFPIEDIEVSLAPRWATFVRSHRWHRSQESFTRAGRVHVRLRVRICPEIVSWILGFGPDARVIHPPLLKKRIARLAGRWRRPTRSRNENPAGRTPHSQRRTISR
jgi:predicted DNA-binding transcriptional regulator YafY